MNDHNTTTAADGSIFTVHPGFKRRYGYLVSRGISLGMDYADGTAFLTVTFCKHGDHFSRAKARAIIDGKLDAALRRHQSLAPSTPSSTFVGPMSYEVAHRFIYRVMDELQRNVPVFTRGGPAYLRYTRHEYATIVYAKGIIARMVEEAALDD